MWRTSIRAFHVGQSLKAGGKPLSSANLSARGPEIYKGVRFGKRASHEIIPVDSSSLHYTHYTSFQTTFNLNPMTWCYFFVDFTLVDKSTKCKSKLDVEMTSVPSG